jgi:hypothetical protein
LLDTANCTDRLGYGMESSLPVALNVANELKSLGALLHLTKMLSVSRNVTLPLKIS